MRAAAFVLSQRDGRLWLIQPGMTNRDLGPVGAACEIMGPWVDHHRLRDRPLTERWNPEDFSDIY